MQISLIQIDNYGPWTTTPEPKPETEIQTLQSRLYSDICQLIDGLVFFARFDNIIAVSRNSIGKHEKIQSSISDRYPVTISIGIGRGNTPREAIEEATSVLQQKGSAQDPNRKEVLAVGDKASEITDLKIEKKEAKSGDGGPQGYTYKDINVAHFDEIDATSRVTDTMDAFKASLTVEKSYSVLAQEMWENYDSITFFVGGDNFISVTDKNMDADNFKDVVEKVKKETETELKVGVGKGKPTKAGMKAKIALEKCRETGKKIIIQN